jgi:hypothetical protein
MIGVQGDQHVVLFGQAVRRLCQDDRAESGILDVEARGKLAAARGNLNDSIGLFVAEGLERPVDGDDLGDVNGGIRVVARLGCIEHRRILFGGGNGHRLNRFRRESWTRAMRVITRHANELQASAIGGM